MRLSWIFTLSAFWLNLHEWQKLGGESAFEVLNKKQ